MNNDRRKRLSAIMSELEDLRSQLDLVKDEEQDAFDNLPESLQDSERGEQMSAALDNLDAADGMFDELLSAIEDAKE